jgi:hypothetical protein
LFDNGYIRTYRKILNWEWFKDGNTLKLFLYFLLSANYKPASWQGVQINPGQLIITFRRVAEETGLTMREFRTSIEHLKSTQEITYKSTHQYTLVTIANWALYQSCEEEATQQTTSKATRHRHTTDTRPTHIEEREEVKEGKNTFISLVTAYTDDIGLQEALLGWVEMRQLKKKGFTLRALKIALGTLDKLVGDKTQLVDHATQHSWEGFYPIQEYQQSSTKFDPTVKKDQGSKPFTYESRL